MYRLLGCIVVFIVSSGFYLSYGLGEICFEKIRGETTFDNFSFENKTDMHIEKVLNVHQRTDWQIAWENQDQMQIKSLELNNMHLFLQKDHLSGLFAQSVESITIKNDSLLEFEHDMVFPNVRNLCLNHVRNKFFHLDFNCFPELEELHVFYSNSILQKLPVLEHVKKLVTHGCGTINFIDLLSCFPNLEELSISSESVIHHWPRYYMPKLKCLTLKNHAIQDLSNLLTFCPSLEKLSLYGIMLIKNWPSVYHFHLREVDLRRSSFQDISTMSRSLMSLEKLYIDDNNMLIESLKQIKKYKPDCEIMAGMSNKYLNYNQSKKTKCGACSIM